MKFDRFLITGGAGFIGSHLVDRLLQENAERVVVVDNFYDFYDPKIKWANIAEHLQHPNYGLVEADICNLEALRKIFTEERFDAIIHLAARAGVRPSLAQPQEYYEINVNGTLNLLELAREYQVNHFIFGSSSSVYGIGVQPPFRENAPLRPISPYAATKAAAEMLVHTYSHLYGITAVCLRFFTAYGARQRPDLAIHKFAQLMTEQKAIPVYGDGSTERDYTYIDDIVNGIMAALDYQATPFEIINLGESQTVTLNRLIQLLEVTLDCQALIERHELQPGDLLKTCADISKAKRLLNYQPATSIEAGIQKFTDWFKNTRSKE